MMNVSGILIESLHKSVFKVLNLVCLLLIADLHWHQLMMNTPGVDSLLDVLLQPLVLNKGLKKNNC